MIQGGKKGEERKRRNEMTPSFCECHRFVVQGVRDMVPVLKTKQMYFNTNSKCDTNVMKSFYQLHRLKTVNLQGGGVAS